MDPDKFIALKKRVEKLRTEKDKAQGALDQLKRELLDKYGCSTVAEAKQLLAKLERETNEAEKEFQESYRNFEKEFGNYCEEDH